MFINVRTSAGNIAFVVLLTYTTSVSAHSWLACVDYTEKNAGTYEHAKCRGYARNARNLAPKGGEFGADTGDMHDSSHQQYLEKQACLINRGSDQKFEYKIWEVVFPFDTANEEVSIGDDFDFCYDFHPSETNPCKDSRNDALHYDANHPKAVYYPGQQVVLAHPMKNHGSDSCTNAYIPDNGNFIYRGDKNANSDSTLSGFQQNLVADLGVKDSSLPLGQYPRPGYQNAPKFCENTDKSLGTYSFNVPQDIEPGYYTFIWLWAFNSAQDLYSGCFDVEIVGTLAERNSELLSNGFSDFYEPCGGSTSKSGVAGNTNPGCGDGSISGTTTTTTTVTSTTTTEIASTLSTNPTNSQNLIVLANQMAGYISLEAPEDDTIRRYLKLEWECPGIEVKFWGARVTSKDVDDRGASYELLQEGEYVDSNQVFFHASFGEGGCNQLSYPPVATHIKDE